MTQGDQGNGSLASVSSIRLRYWMFGSSWTFEPVGRYSLRESHFEV